MRGIIKQAVAVTIILLGTAFATATAYTPGTEATSLSGVSATGAGTDFSLPLNGNALPSKFTWQTTFTGTPTSITVNFEISLDDTTWTQADQSTSTAGETRSVVNKPARFMRCNITSATFNGATASCFVTATY